MKPWRFARSISRFALATSGLSATAFTGRALPFLVALLDGVSYPGQVATALGLTRSNVSNHLSCLRGCGLVVATYEGRQVRYALANEHLTRALRELVQVVLAVDTAQPCMDEDPLATARAAPSRARR